MFVAAETWFGIVFVTLVAVCPARLKTTVLGVFLFLMNNIGGNLPVLVNPISKLLGYRSPVLSPSNDHFLLCRTALMLLFPGSMMVCGVLFLLSVITVHSQIRKKQSTISTVTESQI